MADLTTVTLTLPAYNALRVVWVFRHDSNDFAVSVCIPIASTGTLERSIESSGTLKHLVLVEYHVLLSLRLTRVLPALSVCAST